MLLIYCVALTLSCSAILNHAESTGSQNTSSIGLPTESTSDEIVWNLGKKGRFTVKSVYNGLTKMKMVFFIRGFGNGED